jgi:hypothetical protein
MDLALRKAQEDCTESYLLNEGLKLERELNAANDRIKRLEDWKQSALEIEREWDANAVATMLGAKLGESHRKVIQREVPLLLERIKRLEREIELFREHADYGDVCIVEVILKGEEIGRKENQNQQ